MKGEIMTLKDFIKENRAGIDKAINSVLYKHNGQGGRGVIPDPPPRRGDKERRLWILNDEVLYRWARQEGVNLHK